MAETLFRMERYRGSARQLRPDAERQSGSPHRAGRGLRPRVGEPLQLKRLRPAVAEFRRLLSNYPENPNAPSATFYLARMLAEAKRHRRGGRPAPAVRLQVSRHTCVPAARYTLAQALIDCGGSSRRPRRRCAAFFAAYPRHELAAQARRAVTDAVVREGRQGRSWPRSTRRLVAQSPATAEGLYDAGLVAGKLGRPRDADAAWARLRKDFPDHPLSGRVSLEMAQSRLRQEQLQGRGRPREGGVPQPEDAVRGEAFVLLGESELEAEAPRRRASRPSSPPPRPPRSSRRCATGRWPAPASPTRSSASGRRPRSSTTRWRARARTRRSRRGPRSGWPRSNTNAQVRQGRRQAGAEGARQGLDRQVLGQEPSHETPRTLPALSRSPRCWPSRTGSTARAEIALILPPPDPAALVPLASPPLDKPPVPLPAVRAAAGAGGHARPAAGADGGQPGRAAGGAAGAAALPRVQPGGQPLRGRLRADRVRPRAVSARRARRGARRVRARGAGGDRARADPRGAVLARRDAAAPRQAGRGREAHAAGRSRTSRAASWASTRPTSSAGSRSSRPSPIARSPTSTPCSRPARRRC